MEMDKLISEFIWKSKRPRITKVILKKNKMGGLLMTDRKIVKLL